MLSDRGAKTRYDSLIGNMQAKDEWAASERESRRGYSEGTSTGKYTGFYQKVLQRKREASEAIFEKRKEIDLDEELQKLERIKELRRSKFDEHRERVNQEKLRQLTNIYF